MARPNAHRGGKRGVMTIADMVADPRMAYEALKDGVRCRICGRVTKDVDLYKRPQGARHSYGCALTCKAIALMNRQKFSGCSCCPWNQ